MDHWRKRDLININFSQGSRSASAVDSVWQWDYGQVIGINGVTLPDEFEVHFYNTGENTAIVQEARTNEIPLPDELLENGKDILVYIHTGDGHHGATQFTGRIHVIPRPKPVFL